MYNMYTFEKKTLQQRIEGNEEMMLKTIKKYMDKHGNSPSIRDLTKDMGFGSTSTTHSYLNRLKKKELIDYKTKTHRSIRVLEKEEKRA
ncbi:SOS-response transcriptional repressor LexA [Metabacillus crassostreae]|uniref:LexA family protein n=1 Tax=Metabacillus crassostreae TaxID=929098 RepID=UPI00195A25B8|nr:hypothetical protein [Metabacillus crassostreae]MBM7605969.1 SOS-response transcriptional repressor LexA [Metabacillus crassostreae]